MTTELKETEYQIKRGQYLRIIDHMLGSLTRAMENEDNDFLQHVCEHLGDWYSDLRIDGVNICDPDIDKEIRSVETDNEIKAVLEVIKRNKGK